ncbi:MAG TPA: RNA 2',3'-cyclic phosphodiesterase [Dehalococcoidia bacterium]|nr:RNA 2',3'-cyclic phosphodiesterase [Dehalococcoidia bacterium]
MEQIRAFIAIELPEEIKSALGQLQAELKKTSPPPVKWVDPEAIHLTLKFLGNIATEKVDKITKVIEEAAEGISPFHLEVKGLGTFPNLRKVRVIWVGVEGELAPLSQLQRRIESKLAPLGFAPEGRPFTPHLTLGRVREQASSAEQQRLGQLIASTRFEGNHRFEVSWVSLMRSQLTREGAIYHRLSAIRLK